MTIYPAVSIERSKKEELLKQRSKVIWLMGLSGSGKSTLSYELSKKLHQDGYLTQSIDGDNLRSGMNKDLHFSESDRIENIRRAAQIAVLFLNCGIITIASFISPSDETRQMIRNIISEEDLIDVFLDCPLEVCEERDTKGLYKKARAGKIDKFTGISAPFQPAHDAKLCINTHLNTIESAVEQIYQFVLPLIKYQGKS